MWKRDQATKPANNQPAPLVMPSLSMPAAPLTETPEHRPAAPIVTDAPAATAVPIGKSVVIKGELSASEALTIEGTVEGTIELRENVLTIGPHGRIKAQVFAKTVVVLGRVDGNITASERVDIRDGGAVEGDIVSPRVAIADGAHLRGAVDMQKRSAPPGKASTDHASAPRVGTVDKRANDPQVTGLAR